MDESLKIKDIEKICKIDFTIYKDYSGEHGVFKEFLFPPEYIHF